MSVLWALPAPAAGVDIVNAKAQLVTHPAGGAFGADASRLQNTSLGMIGTGYAAGVSNDPSKDFRLADDFTLTTPAIIDSVAVYAYQTGSPVTSTFDDFRVQIWDGDPALPGSNVIFGDTTSNRMTSTAFTGIYRDTETAVGNAQRPIMEVTAGGLSLPLAAGTYWLAFQVGSPLSGPPFVPPLTTLGLRGAPGANAEQWHLDDWGAVRDDGVAQGLAFHITGVVAPSAALGPATLLRTSSATLPGSINPGGAPTTYHFDYGPTASYGLRTADAVLAPGGTPVPVSVAVKGLAPGRTYHYRLVANNSFAIAETVDGTFTTLRRLRLGPLKLLPSHLGSGRGGRLAFALSDRAQVTMVVDRLVPGRRVAGRCRPAAATGTRCVTPVRRAVVTRVKAAGARVTFPIAARFRNRPLAPGRYRITLIARDKPTGRVSNVRRIILLVNT